MMLTDSHCHLSFKDYPPGEIDVILDRAAGCEVGLMINIGAGEGFEGNLKAVELANRHPNIYATVGIHPHDAKSVTPEMMVCLEKLALENKKVVAIGEIGLDFHYSHSPHDIQEEVFTRFLFLAKKIDKPVMIHDRSAEEKTYDILRDSGIAGIKIMIHCFTGTADLAKKYLDLGCFISFTGIITFKKSDALREVVKMVPLSRLLIETDSPYLTPEPYRGKRNEPAYVRFVAESVAKIKNVSLEEVARQTTNNAKSFFSID